MIGFIEDYNNVSFREAVETIDNKAFDKVNQSINFVKKVRIPLALEQKRHENLEDINK